MSLEEYFSTGPPWERPIFDAVMAHMGTVGPVHVEPVSVGIFLKRARSFAQLRPMTKWETLSLSLNRREAHPLITRKVQAWSGRYYHVFNLKGPEDLDDRLRGWLTEAYLDSPA
jgi:hypothetical protein